MKCEQCENPMLKGVHTCGKDPIIGMTPDKDYIEPTMVSKGIITREQDYHLITNIHAFDQKYQEKYIAGQKEHGGNMWTMGAYQALENAEDEALDNWSYLRQIRKCLDEIREVCNSVDLSFGSHCDACEDIINIMKILNRVKDDGDK